jgi:mannose-6-phosphate isomerase-like protein (cupin superfamily)
MKLIISGTIQDHEYFDRQVKPFLNNDQIIFTDCTGPEKRNQLFGNAYALLHSTKSDQHSRLFIAEAMACGTPVIALINGSMPEFIADGITGFLVPDSDEMIRAVSEIKQLDRSQCRQWAEDRFSADAMVENYISIYKNILEQTKREDHRPWGFYEILLDAPDHKVKRITVYPGQRLSYQRHFRRSEHWYVIGGTAVITRNGDDIELTFGQSIDLPVGTWHRVRNPGSENMVFIEVQTGDYFGEDDIERSEDDYGRR